MESNYIYARHFSLLYYVHCLTFIDCMWHLIYIILMDLDKLVMKLIRVYIKYKRWLLKIEV